MGAKLPAAEAADACMVVEDQLPVPDLDGPGGASVSTDPAEFALCRNGTGAGGEVVAEAILQEGGEPPLDVR